MALGVFDDSQLGVSEFGVPDGSAGNSSKVMVTVPLSYNKAQGQMDFFKRTAGGEIYIGLCGKKCTSKNYDIVLTDGAPAYNIAGLALGDIYVLGSAPNLLVNATILICSKPG